MTEVLVRRVSISENFVLEFFDRSNRYFGDYSRVLIEIVALLDSADGPLRLHYQHPLKKMGVAGSEIEAETARLIDQFLETTVPYMSQPGFIPQLLLAMNRPGQRLWTRS